MFTMALRTFRETLQEAILCTMFLVATCKTVKTEKPNCEYIVNSTQGIVTSPNYPQEYPDSIHCVWKFETRPGYIIKLEFNSFELQEDCNADNVAVYDSEAGHSILLGSYCGKSIPPPIKSTSNKILLVLTTDASMQFSGFKVTYFTEPKCLQILNSTEGHVTSPGFPNEYPLSAECFYIFESTPGNRIKLTFNFFDVGLLLVGCGPDYVHFYDGESVNSTDLGILCGTGTPNNPIVSTSHKMLMVFHSSDSYIFGGFNATYSTEPIPVLRSKQGVITTPNYPNEYPEFSTEVWKIEYKPGYIIKLEFNSFYVEHDVNCSRDYVAIYDGESTSETLLGKYCGFEIPPPVISTSHKMLIEFRSDDSKEYKGFSATYSTKPIQVVKSYQGVIETPKYPDKYENYIWKIDYRPGYIIKLEFDSIALELTEDCSADYVAIYDGESMSGTLLGRYCGTEIPPPMISTSHKMLIVFHSSGSMELKGFKAKYSTNFNMKSVVSDEIERNLIQSLLSTRGLDKRAVNKWGFNVTKIALALFLHDPQFFASGNQTGEDIIHELILQVFSMTLNKEHNLWTSEDFSLFINAMTVACINPRVFYNRNFVKDLRIKADNSILTDPFAILTLCKAGETLKEGDISKLQQLFNSSSSSTKTRAIIVMAMKCISGQPNRQHLESVVTDMRKELKKKKQRNGAIENLETTALVVQALIAIDSTRFYFNLHMAVKYMLEEIKQGRAGIEDIYYILPIFKWKTLLDINSHHCQKPIRTDLLMDDYLREHPSERIEIPISTISIIIGNNADSTQTWRMKMPTNFTFYQETANSSFTDSGSTSRCVMSGGEPYVNVFASHPENKREVAWFIYSKSMLSSDGPVLVADNSADIPVNETNVLIMWYPNIKD